MLTELPVIVVDALLRSYLTDNDLRVVHQVSMGWKRIIEERTKVNLKRLTLVELIREHKENIERTNEPPELPLRDKEGGGGGGGGGSVSHSLHLEPEVEKREEKSSSRTDDEIYTNAQHEKVLRVSSVVNTLTPPSSSNERKGGGGEESLSGDGSSKKRFSYVITPRAGFQRRYEAGLKLLSGQILFSCPDCSSPVPSPISSLNKSSSSPSYTRTPLRKTSSPSIIKTPTTNRSQNEENETDSGLGLSLESSSGDTNLYASPLEGRYVSLDIYATPEMKPKESSSKFSPKKFSPSSIFKSCFSSSNKSAHNVSVSEFDVGYSTPPAAVVECPDCSYRFCSRCKYKEHGTEACKLLGDIGEEEDENSNIVLNSSGRMSVNKGQSSNPSKLAPNKGARTRSTSSKGPKKSSLRRLKL